MRVELSRIIGVKNEDARNAIIDEIIKEAEDDPVFISDLLIEHDTAEPILSDLRSDHRERYVLQVLRDEWGDKPVPGEFVKRKEKNPLKTKGNRPIPAKTLNNWKRAGIYDKKRYSYKNIPIDKKGCITVSAVDAEYFLTQWGVHSVSGMPISYHAMEHSEEPVDCPKGGKRHVWYYRFKEMDKAMYEALPVLSIETKEREDKRK